MAQFEITLLTDRHGAVEGHKAGCADVARKVRKERLDEPWTFDVENKIEAWGAYNSDFLAECDVHANCDEEAGICANAYHIDWKPCANAVPERAELAGDDVVEPDFLEPVGVKINKKQDWTYIRNADDELIAKVRNDSIEFVRFLMVGQ